MCNISSVSQNAKHALFQSMLTEAIPNDMQRGLAYWGLDGSHIDAISFHGTSTAGNDKNESEINNNIIEDFKCIAKDKCANRVPVVCQKYLTGHAKGASFGYMLNGTLQMLRDRTVPGNKNADNIDGSFEGFSNLYYPDESRQTFVNSVLMHSFGFGQANCQVMIVHPDHLLRRLSDDVRANYKTKFTARRAKQFRMSQDALHGIRSYVMFPNVKSDNKPKSICSHPLPVVPTTTGSPHRLVQTTSQTTSVGVDTQCISKLPLNNPIFIERNYTKTEREYCEATPLMKEHRYGGRWAAKESTIKAIYGFMPEESVSDMDPTKALIDIEIRPTTSGQPSVSLHGPMKELATQLDVREISVSISHDGDTAFAVTTITRHC
jgi:phosphopantetheine--protein transferase-like protein